MKLVKTKGIIIAEHNMADYDKMLTILTPNLGKIQCLAKGSRKPKSLLLAGSQLLCFGEYILYNYSMNSCEIIELFYNIRTDLEKLQYATYITKIISDVTTENQNNFRLLQLYLNTLYVLSETKLDFDLIISIFRIRLMSLMGFKPQIEECTTCRNKQDLNTFSIRDSGLKCKACAKQDSGAIEISQTTKDAIRYIILADAKKIFSFTVPEDTKKELEIVSKLYLTEKLEKEYKL